MSYHPATPRPEEQPSGSPDSFVFDFGSGPAWDGAAEASSDWPSVLSGDDGGTAPLPPLDGDPGYESVDGDAPAPDAADGDGPLLDASAFFDSLAEFSGAAAQGETGLLLSDWAPSALDGGDGAGWQAPLPLNAPQSAISGAVTDRLIQFDPSGAFGLPSAKGGNGGGNGGGKPPDGGGGGGGGDPVLTEYTAGSADGEAGFDIQLDFAGGNWTATLQQAFIDTADYLVSVITDDIGGGARYRGTVIDDLYISAEVTQIDGTGGVLGQAGPTAAWTTNDLTAAGQMQFDVADAADFFSRGLWDDIIIHEMMHVLGFGTLWNYGSHAGLVQNGSEYVGPNALAAYNDALGLTGTGNEETFIPVETDGGSGTAGGHWDEAALTNELMTGYINDDHDPYSTGDNVLSKFSVMALADLGYAIDYTPWTDTAYTDPLIA